MGSSSFMGLVVAGSFSARSSCVLLITPSLPLPSIISGKQSTGSFNISANFLSVHMDQNIELQQVHNPQHPPVQNPQHPPIQNPHHRDNIRKAATLTVAVLFVAITYQAILSPPGGCWPRDGYKNSALLHSLPHSRAVKVPVAGKSILATKDSAMFTVFLTLNTLGFLYSVVAIYDLTEVPRKCELMTALLAIVGSYLMCTIIITPKLMQYLPILTCLCVSAVVYCCRSCRKAWSEA